MKGSKGNKEGRLCGSDEERKGVVVHERDAHDHGLVGGAESAGVDDRRLVG